jgi:PTS system ascorbate-specific IIA component
MNDGDSAGTAPADVGGGAMTGPSMIGILIIAHDSLGEGLARAVTHVLGSRPPQFEVLSVAATDDPLMLLPAARELVSQLDTGSGVLVFSDIYGASPCNLAGKLLKPGRVEGSPASICDARAHDHRARGMKRW